VPDGRFSRRDPGDESRQHRRYYHKEDPAHENTHRKARSLFGRHDANHHQDRGRDPDNAEELNRQGCEGDGSDAVSEQMGDGSQPPGWKPRATSLVMPPAATAESSHAGHEDEESDPKTGAHQPNRFL
jgi:hypothetical protein